jgi:hypothetical protein
MRYGVAICLLSLLALVVLGCGSTQNPSSSSASPVAPKAEQFVDLLAKGDYPAATASFDATMKQAMPAAKLQEAWQGLIAQAGAFQKRTAVRTAQEQGFDAAYVTCQFAKGPVDVKVVFSASGEISGLWFVPMAK